jgi:hypothetical protein
MPEYQPEVWNDPGIGKINNCYNYAVDDLHRVVPGKRPPIPAEPGAKHDVTAGYVIAAEPTGDGYTTYTDYSCEGIRTAAIVDGLADVEGHAGIADDGCYGGHPGFVRPSAKMDRGIRRGDAGLPCEYRQ